MLRTGRRGGAGVLGQFVRRDVPNVLSRGCQFRRCLHAQLKRVQRPIGEQGAQLVVIHVARQNGRLDVPKIGDLIRPTCIPARMFSPAFGQFAMHLCGDSLPLGHDRVTASSSQVLCLIVRHTRNERIGQTRHQGIVANVLFAPLLDRRDGCE
jgi:hypothetical protein